MLAAVALAISLSTPNLGAWSVNPNNTLFWAGQPYLPIGARVSGDKESIQRAIDAGVRDLIVELPINGAGWDDAISILKASNARWFLAVSSAAPAALGTAVEPQGYRLDIEGKLDVDLQFPGAESVFALIADKRTALTRWYKTIPTPDGRLKTTFDSQVESPHVLLLYPVVRDLQTPDFWEGFDRMRDTLLDTLKAHDLGPGFRGIIDPMGSVARFPTPDIMFVPRSPIFAMEMESFLKEKYGAVSTCVRAWSIGAHDLETWQQLSRLVPLWSETKGVQSVWDPVTDKIYPSDRQRSTIWGDIRMVLHTTAVRRFSRLIQSIHGIVDVPVLQTWGGWTGPYDSQQAGTAGIGCEIEASNVNDVIEGASRPASTVLQGDFDQVMMVTDLRVNQGARLDISSAISELGGMGARGWFVRSDDPAVLQEVADIAKKHASDTSDSEWKPKALFFPEGAHNPAMPVRLFGGTWMLPSPAAGNRLDFGSQLRGYYYDGPPHPYTVIWASGDPVKTKLFVSDPKALKVEAMDGSEVRIRTRNDSVELEITDVPLVFSGIDDVPIPDVSYSELSLNTAALFSNFEALVDPGGEQQYLFAENANAFKRNPAGGFLSLTKQFYMLAPRAAPYLWIEAETSRDTNFGEAKFVPGASSGSALVLESKLPTSSGYYATYHVRPKIKGSHEIWLAANIPPDLRDKVSILVGTTVLQVQSSPIELYGLGFGWYKFGSADIDGDTDIRINVFSAAASPIDIDVLVASPKPFHPDGAEMPLDFLNPGS